MTDNLKLTPYERAILTALLSGPQPIGVIHEALSPCESEPGRARLRCCRELAGAVQKLKRRGLVAFEPYDGRGKWRLTSGGAAALPAERS